NRLTPPQVSKEFQTHRPAFADPGLEALLESKGVVIDARDESGPSWLKLLIGFGPTLLLIAAFGAPLRPAAGGGGGAARAVGAGEEPRQALPRDRDEGPLRRRRRHRRGRERADRDRRLPEE